MFLYIVSRCQYIEWLTDFPTTATATFSKLLCLAFSILSVFASFWGPLFYLPHTIFCSKISACLLYLSLSICLSLSPIPFSNVVSFSLLNHFLGCFIVLFPDPILSFQDGSFYLSFSYFAAINSFLSIYGELLNYGPSSSLDFSRQCPVWDSNPW